MTTYAALLRAVNLAGHNKVAMMDILEWMASIGMRNPRTLLQSGNVVFESTGSSAVKLEHALEASAITALGLSTDFMLRSRREWHDLVATNPFPREAESDPSRLVVMFLKKAPTKTALIALRGAITGREVVHAGKRELYVVYPDGIGTSKLTTGVIERTLGTRSTGRNWNTVMKVEKLLGVRVRG